MSLLSRTRQQPSTPPGRVLTAAGVKIDLHAPRRTRKASEGAAEWQEHAWAYRDSIGEIRYAIAYLRHACSRVRVMPALAEPDGSPPTPLAEAEGVPAGVVAAAEDALSRLTSGTNNWGALLGPLAENFEVPGEGYLVGRVDVDRGEVWESRSVQEVQATDRGWVVKDSPGDKDGTVLDPETSFVARLWQPHPRWRAWADSPMRALLGPCEELQLVSRMIRAASRSRVAGAGLLLLPDSIDFKSPTGEPDPEDLDADPFLATLTRAMTTAIADEGDASAVVPITITAAAEAIKEVRHITLASPVDEKLLARQEAALRRLGAGLDVPPEIVTGMADVNHWTAWQVDSDTIRMHVEPLLVRILDAVTEAYLREALTASGVDPVWARRVIAWYDVSPLTVRPNRADDAARGHDALVLSDRALVEALGFDPEADMPDEAELMRRLALKRGAMDGSITEALLRQLLLPVLDNVRHLPPGQVTVHAGQDAQDAERENPPVVQGETAPPALPPAPSQPAEDPPADDAPENQPGDQPEETPGPNGQTAHRPMGVRVYIADQELTYEHGFGAAGQPEPRVLRAHVRESTRLADIDRSLRDQLTSHTEAALTRAVERAANRARSQGNRSPEHRGATDVGALVAAMGLDPEDLFAGAWDDLRARWDDLTAAARDTALAHVIRIAGLDTDDPAVQAQLDALAGRLATSAGEAWGWLVDVLGSVALDALTDPDSVDGVADPTGDRPGVRGRLASLVRAALARAGGIPPGNAGTTRDGTPVDPGTRIPGLASGDLVGGFLRDAGQEIIGYEWVYGISRRHFGPHRALDGAMFADFGHPILANPDPGGWPAAFLAPGDHRGCNCDAQPVWADGTLSSTDLGLVGDLTYDPAYLQVLERVAAADTAAGLTGTTPQKVVAEAHRVANARPAQSGRP